MDNQDWLQRWRDGRTGFHTGQVHPALHAHWDRVDAAPGSTVFVPLCGRAEDMTWLAGAGLQVTGVELSPLAVQGFFDARGLTPVVTQADGLRCHVAGPWRLWCGDYFALSAGLLAPAGHVYDRAALIALPANVRGRYLAHLRRLLPGGFSGLLITLEYDQRQMDGPPFAVLPDELEAHLHDNAMRARLLARRDVLAEEPRFRERGVSALAEASWLLQAGPLA